MVTCLWIAILAVLVITIFYGEKYVTIQEALDSIKQKQADEHAAVTAAFGRLHGSLTTLAQQVADLQTQVANGQNLSADQLTEVQDTIGDMQAEIEEATAEGN